MRRLIPFLLPLAALGAGVLAGRSLGPAGASRASERRTPVAADPGGARGPARVPVQARASDPSPPPSPDAVEAAAPRADDEWTRLVGLLALGPVGSPEESLAFLLDTWLRLGRRADAARVAHLLLPTRPLDEALLALLVEQAPSSVVRHLRDRVAEDPENPLAHGWLGQALLASGDRAGAYGPLLRALDLGGAAASWAPALLRANGERAAADLLRIFLDGDVEDDEEIGDVADLLMDAGRRAEAALLFARALEIDAGDDEWVRGLLRSDAGRAEEHYRSVLARSPTHGDALVGLGLLLLSQGKEEEAASRILASVQDYAKALPDEVFLLPYERSAAELRRLAEGGSGRPGVWAALARLEAVAGNLPEALEAYRRAAADFENPASAYEEWAAVDPVAASQALAKELSGPRASAQLRCAYAMARLALGDRAGAADAFRLAFESGADLTHRAADWARVDPTAALAYMEDATRGSADDETLGDLADVYEATGAGESAFTTFLRAHEADLADFEWQLGIARTGGARAVPVLRNRLVQTPESADVWGALGVAYERAGDADGARDAYARALARGDVAREVFEGSVRVDARGFRAALEVLARGPDVTRPALWWALGVARAASGDTAGAARARRVAARLDPTRYLARS